MLFSNIRLRHDLMEKPILQRQMKCGDVTLIYRLQNFKKIYTYYKTNGQGWLKEEKNWTETIRTPAGEDNKNIFLYRKLLKPR